MTSPQKPGGPRCIDTPVGATSALSNAIEDMYDDALDVAVVRGAWAPTDLVAVAATLDRGEVDPGWKRPNASMPPDDIQVLGTAATPTYATPRGPTLEAYMEDADWYDRTPLFGKAFDPASAITGALSRHTGGRPVESPDPRPTAVLTFHRAETGRGQGHRLASRSAHVVGHVQGRRACPRHENAGQLRLHAAGPRRRRELCVYDCAPDTPDPPKLPNGFSWDLAGVEARFGSVKIDTGAGDLFFFPSARLLHRVAPVSGGRARITLGGFLALDKSRERVLYWS